jgi:hypothetical protein
VENIMAQGSMPHGSAQLSSEIASELMDKATERVGQVADTIEDVTSKVKELGEHVQEVAKGLKGPLKNSVDERPMATLLGAVAVGFVLGALWKS